MTISREHSDTEARPSGLEGRIQGALEWIVAHRRLFLIGLGGLLGVVGLIAIAAEVMRARRTEAQSEWAAIEAQFVADMGAQPTDVVIPEPASPEQARRARESALERYEAFSRAQGRSDLGRNSRLRAAELEVDLGRLEAADTRLQGLVAELDRDDPRKAIALRLRGYVLEELDRPEQAAELYEAGGALEAYPARALLWLAAARTHLRLGAHERALRAFDQALALEPDLAADPGLARERKLVETELSLAAPAAAQTPATPAVPAAKP